MICIFKGSTADVRRKALAAKSAQVDPLRTAVHVDLRNVANFGEFGDVIIEYDQSLYSTVRTEYIASRYTIPVQSKYLPQSTIQYFPRYNTLISERDGQDHEPHKERLSCCDQN